MPAATCWDASVVLSELRPAERVSSVIAAVLNWTACDWSPLRYREARASKANKTALEEEESLENAILISKSPNSLVFWLNVTSEQEAVVATIEFIS